MKYLTLLVFLGISLLCEAQQDSIVPFEKAYKRTYNIRKVSGVKPTIDGKLDEDFWTKQGEWSDRFVQIIPYERAITQSPTRVKLFYDDKYIYVGVYCKDAVPDKMNRFIGNRAAAQRVPGSGPQARFSPPSRSSSWCRAACPTGYR